MSFHGLVAHFSLALNDIPLSGGTTVCVSICRRSCVQRSLVGYSPCGSQRVGHNCVTEHVRTHGRNRNCFRVLAIICKTAVDIPCRLLCNLKFFSSFESNDTIAGSQGERVFSFVGDCPAALQSACTTGSNVFAVAFAGVRVPVASHPRQHLMLSGF